MLTRKIMLCCWLMVVFTGIGFLFWHNEWKFNLPTPVPAGYHAVATGSVINIAAITDIKTGKPVFLHFFNPSCPCSRFNLTHFKSLVKNYGDRISFVVVVIGNDKNYNASFIQYKYDLAIPVLFNPSIAEACGVYSTPQAAIIDTDNKLWYRGNYNKSRYCTAASSNYAQIAVDSLLAQHRQPLLSEAAFKSYGCQVPYCNK